MGGVGYTEVREVSGRPPGSPEGFGKVPQKSVSGWEGPPEVRERSGWPLKSGKGRKGPPEVRERSGGPTGSPGGVVRAPRKSRRGREGTLEV